LIAHLPFSKHHHHPSPPPFITTTITITITTLHSLSIQQRSVDFYQLLVHFPSLAYCLTKLLLTR
jgi:hypothetical protein